jgi:putative pre-16S rRNA nuclease
VLALDVGKRRIGLAGTDPTGALVLPLEVLKRRSAREDLDHLLGVIDDRKVQVLVVGIPIREDGSEGKIAKDARFFAGKLAALRPALQIEFHDEAYTTVEAEDRLRKRGMDGRKRKAVVDAVAAQVILESWLAARAQPAG